VENQHRKIRGYRELTQEEINLMNEIKEQGLVLEALVKKAKKHVADQRERVQGMAADKQFEAAADENARLHEAEPERWAALGKTHFQEGLMALTRSIAQPSFF
jgi:hypothetical protein